jgi:hypothetical protein
LPGRRSCPVAGGRSGREHGFTRRREVSMREGQFLPRLYGFPSNCRHSGLGLVSGRSPRPAWQPRKWWAQCPAAAARSRAQEHAGGRGRGGRPRSGCAIRTRTGMKLHAFRQWSDICAKGEQPLPAIFFSSEPVLN